MLWRLNTTLTLEVLRVYLMHSALDKYENRLHYCGAQTGDELSRLML
jgi:hypothetical protein